MKNTTLAVVAAVFFWPTAGTFLCSSSLWLQMPPFLSRRVAGAAVSDLPHWLGHRCEVGTVTWAPAGLRLPWQLGQTVGHQKVCEVNSVYINIYNPVRGQ